MVIAALAAGGGPILDRQLPLGNLMPLDGFHHLTNQTVRQHHDGIAVLIGDVECLLGEVHGLLNVGGARTTVR